MQNHSSHSFQSQAKKRRSTKTDHTIIVDENEIQQRYRSIVNDLESLLKKLYANSLVLNYGSKVVTAKPCDIIRVLSEWSQKDTIDLTIRNIIISAILSAENKQIGSGVICAYKLIDNCEKTYLSKRNTLENRAEPRDIDRTLGYFLGTGVLFKLMKQIIYSGGLAADLRFSYTSTNDFIVKTTATKEVIGEIHPLFETKLKEIESPLVIAVDGTIESLGEIDHLLQEIASLKTPALLMARGFSPDVITTLDVNWKSDKLKIVPFTVFLWERDEIKSVQEVGQKEGLEVCESLGITCISTLTGGTISNSSIDDFSQHQTVFFSKSGILFQNDEGAMLHTEVKIPKRFRDISGVIRDRCKLAQKACMGVSRTGMCTEQAKTTHMSAEPYVSYVAEAVGVRAAVSCRKMIIELGGLIVS